MTSPVTITAHEAEQLLATITQLRAETATLSSENVVLRLREARLRNVVFYGASRYDDKPHQFWNQMRLAAEEIEDSDAAAVFTEYYEEGCPYRREHHEFRAAIKRALHTPPQTAITAGRAVCDECGEDHPCPTFRSLDEDA